MIRAPAASALVTALLAASGAPRAARADTTLYAVAIGNNAAPASPAGDMGQLHYADDDAAAFFAFARGIGARAQLLADLDLDSQLRFPELVAQARPPTLKELRRTVADLRAAMARDTAAGNRPVLLFFYSGHGLPTTDDRPAALSLQDDGLTQKRLYDDVLAALPDASIHILVDACYAEDVVRPRDLDLRVVDPSAEDVEQLVARTTLARFARVGAIVAAATTGQTHEWDFYHQGVFTHELLSGLRGAADVNDDGAIEYSELSAFLAAANREVPEPRARLKVISHPPRDDRRLPIVELQRDPRALRVRFTGGKPNYFFIEDQRGNRLVEVRSEDGYRFRLYLPAGEPLYFVSPTRTVRFQGRPGDVLDADDFARFPADLRARGAMSDALRQGLFAAPFGPSYYRGFVDRGPEMLSVDFRAPSLSLAGSPRGPAADDNVRSGGVWTTGLFAAAGALGAAALTLQLLAVHEGNAYNEATLERAASAARQRYDRDSTLALAAGAAALGAAGAGGLLLWRRRVARLAPAAVESPTGRMALGAAGALEW